MVEGALVKLNHKAHLGIKFIQSVTGWHDDVNYMIFNVASV